MLSPGVLTTVQDLGRRGYQALGVPVSGAADPRALMVGNALVGNRVGAAGLEITLSGPELEFTGPVAFCLAGGACAAELIPAGGGSPRPVPPYASLLAGPGDRLRIGPVLQGCRVYLCVSGGIEVPRVLGSRATDLLGRLGPFGGRPLRAGDWLPVGQPLLPPADLAGRWLPAELAPPPTGQLTVRVVPGPQAEAFYPEALEVLEAAEYRVGERSDRQGLRLEGPQLRHRDGADILSEGIPLGAVQVPAGGEPILLLAGRQTMGGYAKIAVAVAADAARAGQLRPGDAVRFEVVSVGEAHAIARAEARSLSEVLRFLEAEVAAARRPVDPGPVVIRARLAGGQPPAPPVPVPPAPATPVPPAPAQPVAPDAAAPPAGRVRRYVVRIAGREFAVQVEEEPS